MAFYFALFNVSNVNQELRLQQQAHQLGEKGHHGHRKDSGGLRGKGGKLRRHSLASTHDVGDYRLLPKPTIVPSNSQNFKPSENTPEVSAPMAIVADIVNSENDSDGGKNSKKVTFDASDAIGTLAVAVNGHQKRKLSESSFLGAPGVLSQSAYDSRTASSNRRAAEWIYSIPLSRSRGSMDNGGRSPITPPPTTSTSTMTTVIPRHLMTVSPSDAPYTAPRILCDRCREAADHCGGACGNSSNDEFKRATSRKPCFNQSELTPPRTSAALLRRRSTSDRSASLTTVFRRNTPLPQKLSPSVQRFRCSLVDAGQEMIPLLVDLHADHSITASTVK